ncbi:S1 RNA-binding domain-containing protein [Bacillus hwajinpoensis]|uniref:S1 RNA-binding domain-containing protein n=1 Tax=Guptibacillus hwajinpoensis TaxID=208199 RepID=A0A845F5Y5_9BACL|nr:Tex family protein [Pseudalkalibacillus hwajinpoensis]MYL66076.1 S1 RNA-binding domain-containing protein [Pseudalkalibacillus hwajinpoensis]
MTVDQKQSEHFRKVAQNLKLAERSVREVITLLNDGNTVPFIARYRKELTGGLDEVQLRDIQEVWTYLQNLDQRKEEVIRLIQEQDKLTDELKKQLKDATKLQEIEDIYRPYKQKKRTKATVAKEKGLEPLAQWILVDGNSDPSQVANKYISEENEVLSVEDAIQGAQDIIAEWISDDADARKWIRAKTFQHGLLQTFVKSGEDDPKQIFEMYYSYQEGISKIVPHRILAINRGEKEKVLRTSITPPTDSIHEYLKRKTINNQQKNCVTLLEEAIIDGYKRLIQPSVEREIRKELTERAEDQAIHIFSENLKHLLLQPPLKGKRVLGVDPAYRTGCKLAVVDDTGKMLEVSVIYPTPPKSEVEKSKAAVIQMIKKYDIEMIAIGNGTASRETEQFIADVIKEVEKKVVYLIVNEAGASVYSASDLAREEFPDLQVEERSAVSIARRVQDPLAELVKIDPKSVGVGQYQHDVSQKKLNDQLTFVVETAVNQVGVNVNTASVSLLQYVAGLSRTVAMNIVKKRDEEGKFTSRVQLKKVPRLGAKTYEQCIGFLRIMGGKQPLDQTEIHPESYDATKALLERIECKPGDIGTEKLVQSLSQISLKDTAVALNIGEVTLKDIVTSLQKPGRDPRDELSQPILKTDVLKMEDLEQGMELEGTVRNVVDFGAFIDIGVKQDGLVHISKLTNRYVKNPMEVVHVGQVVTVWVDQVDLKRERIALTMLQPS